jgi:hypothetical protein
MRSRLYALRLSVPFLSGIDTEVDGLSMATFVLHPEGYDGPSRTERTEP